MAAFNIQSDAQHPLTGLTREIARAIMACNSDASSNKGRVASIGELAESVARIPAIAALVPA